MLTNKLITSVYIFFIIRIHQFHIDFQKNTTFLFPILRKKREIHLILTYIINHSQVTFKELLPKNILSEYLLPTQIIYLHFERIL